MKKAGKGLQFCFAVLITIIIMHGTCLSDSAFHSGGSGDCDGCHLIHTSGSGTEGIDTSSTNAYLLRGVDPSSTCLNCHQNSGSIDFSNYYVSTPETDMPAGSPPVHLTPGGDFGWLKKNYSWTPEPGSQNGDSPGERHGHNIIAGDYGYMQDSSHPYGPGGSYPSAGLHCSSCHDPHGKYRRNDDGTITTSGKPIMGSGSYSTSAEPDQTFAVGVYRLLAGAGYTPKSLGSNAFTNGPPAAVAPGAYNRAETTNQTRVAYGRDMSEWCANCHGGFIGSNHLHPAGNGSKLGTAITGNYNAYVKSGDLTGMSASSYLSLIPFEEGVDDHSLSAYSQLKSHAKSDGSFLQGPDSNANVSCITCHRAHASGWDRAGRYNFGSTLVTVAADAGAAAYPDPAVKPELAMGRTIAETQKAYYDRPASTFGLYQRTLCNKCHAKD